MGYHLTTALARPSARSHASPKTHTPLPRLQERGHRYYSTELSRWISRDPIGEKGSQEVLAMGDRTIAAVVMARHGFVLEMNPYRAVRNSPQEYIDFIGLEDAKPKACCDADDPTKPKKTCVEICAMANKDKTVNKGYAGLLVCYGKMLCPCIFDVSLSLQVLGLPREDIDVKVGECPTYDKIRQAHENQHVKEGNAECSGCGLYAAPAKKDATDTGGNECADMQATKKALFDAALKEQNDKCRKAMYANAYGLRDYILVHCDKKYW